MKTQMAGTGWILDECLVENTGLAKWMIDEWMQIGSMDDGYMG